MALSLSLRSARHADLLLVSAGGVLTRTTPSVLRAYISGLLHVEDARAVVCDLRCATLALSADEWTGSVAAVLAAQTQLDPPMALVLSPECTELGRAYSRRMAEAGHIRAVFTHWALACEWASSRMEHWAFPPGRRSPLGAAGRAPRQSPSRLPQTPLAAPPA